jgi:REP element-mobilizing transposase RayT
MARARKRHVQQDLVFRDPEADGRGGKRKGAGRPPKGPRSSERHKRRPPHDPRHPVHVTLRVVPGLGSLRKRDMYRAIREATIVVIPHEGFRIVHFSVQTNHIHLISEASGKQALSRGMQSFEISAAKHINAAVWKRTGVRRRGGVFADRYNSRALTSPRAVRHAVCYVLNNWRRHEEDRASFTRNWRLDPYANGIAFDGWKERVESGLHYQRPETYQPFVTWFPKTWLLREGWKRHGLVSVYEVPGPAHRPKSKRKPKPK